MLETASQVEQDLAKTLRGIAEQRRGDGAARLQGLAGDAARGAQAAAERSARLQGQASRLAEHADLAALRQALDRARAVFADLACAERDIAEILTRLSSRDGSDLATRPRELAAETLAASQHASHLADALWQLAAAGEARTGTPRNTRAYPVGGSAPLEPSPRQRRAGIDVRIPASVPVRVNMPGNDLVTQAARDAQWWAREARRHRQESVASLRQTRELTARALGQTASAHDCVARANEWAARAAIGDVAEHERRAAFHRTAASADRELAQKIKDQDETSGAQHTATGATPPRVKA